MTNRWAMAAEPTLPTNAGGSGIGGRDPCTPGCGVINQHNLPAAAAFTAAAAVTASAYGRITVTAVPTVTAGAAGPAIGTRGKAVRDYGLGEEIKAACVA